MPISYLMRSRLCVCSQCTSLRRALRPLCAAFEEPITRQDYWSQPMRLRSSLSSLETMSPMKLCVPGEFHVQLLYRNAANVLIKAYLVTQAYARSNYNRTKCHLKSAIWQDFQQADFIESRFRLTIASTHACEWAFRPVLPETPPCDVFTSTSTQRPHRSTPVSPVYVLFRGDPPWTRQTPFQSPCTVNSSRRCCCCFTGSSSGCPAHCPKPNADIFHILHADLKG